MISLIHYTPEQWTEEEFKSRYAGTYQKYTGKFLSPSTLLRLWDRFLRVERHDFFQRHTTFQYDDILRIGIDKFVYTLGWRKKTDVGRWRTNKIRIGICCHCNDQFVPLMFQVNHGLCNNCKPLYSSKAMRNFVMRELAHSDRYEGAHRDLLMDFYIMFYYDAALRKLFLKESPEAQEMEKWEIETPKWLEEDLERAMQARQLREAELSGELERVLVESTDRDDREIEHIHSTGSSTEGV